MRLLTFVSAALGLAANALSQARPAAHYDVDRTPFVEIGGDGTGNDPLLAAVFSATKTAQGFVVGESQSATLQFLDARGKVVHTTGRRGQGPGEFMGSIFINQCAGDSLFAWDSRTNRVSVFTASGSFVRQIPAFAARVRSSSLRNNNLPHICPPMHLSAAAASTPSGAPPAPMYMSIPVTCASAV